MIAVHAALLAQQGGQAGADDLRPPRGPGRDHQAPPGDRPPPHRRDRATASWWPRTSRWSWTAARTARCRRSCCRAARSTPAGRTTAPNVRIRGRAMATNTPPNGAFRGFGAPQTEFAAEMQVNRDRRARSACRRSSCGGAGSTAWATRRRRGRSCARASPARRCSSERPRRPSSSASARRRARPASGARKAGARSGARRPHGIGLALAWHGAGFTGSGEVQLGSVASVELTARRRIRGPDRLDRDGPGHQDDLPAARRGALGVAVETWRWRRRTRRSCPTSGPTVASRTAMVVGGLVIRAARRLRDAGRGARPAGRSPSRTATTRGQNGALRIDQQFEPYPGVEFDDETYRGDAYPASAGRRRGGGRRGPRHGRGDGARRRLRRRHRARDPPGPGRGPGRGRHAAGGRPLGVPLSMRWLP